ncbi:MAG TPA: transcriptional repressor [Anaerolineae bacterium]|nr:transcriptional repressor [Anaerolineae bacterium]
MSEPSTRIDELVTRLRARGYRLTPQRMAVLRILASSKGHPSVEQIHQQVQADFPMTSLATIYKTVTLLKEMGEVLELGFSNDSSRYDGNKPHPHPHLVCIRCKEILDPEAPSVGGLSEQLARETGYKIVSHRLDFYGICPRCQKRE